MFEKEAEESSKKAFCIAHSHEDELIYRNGFQQGAEFGYNKANEWNYVKDGDFPEKEGVYLTYRKNGLQLLAFDGSYWVTGVQDDVHNTIIAWKEIVLPELKESE